MIVAQASPALGRFRTRFPMLQQSAYLASCSLGARSSDLDAALTRMLEAMSHQGAPWGQFEDQVCEARVRFATLIGARPEQVAVVPNASVGAYQVASTREWQRRPKIVTTLAEFPSVAHVWLAQRPRGAEVVYVPERDGAVLASDYLACIDDRTGLVSVPLTTYRSGVRLPVAEISAAARFFGARVMVDAYQALGVEPVNVDELGCDYLVGGAMKYLLGLPGVAFLYARSALETDRPPELTGWFGRIDPLAFDPCTLDFPQEARRFETGTPAVPALYAANAGLALIAELDLHEVRRHVSSLVAQAVDELAGQGERLSMPGGSAPRGAHVAFVEPQADTMASWLGARGVVVSPRGNVVRLSFHGYNTAADVARACEEIRAYRATRAGRAGGRDGRVAAAAPARSRRSGGIPDVLGWLAEPDPDTFPYDRVVDEFRRVGKHFVAPELLEVLCRARSAVGREATAPGAALLAQFLDACLDKPDRRYDYVSYLALGILPLARLNELDREAARTPELVEHRRDRLLVQLIADLVAFELAARDGATDQLPLMRPGAETCEKRCRLALKAALPALHRLGLLTEPMPAPGSSLARRVSEAVAAWSLPAERRRVRLAMLPVYVVHDEYLFLRVLQSFEAAFNLMAVQLRAAVGHLDRGEAGEAVRRIRSAVSAQREVAPLFSLLATMQVEAFRIFRTYTEGASAIQSRNYKTVEALCRLPEPARLHSVAYRSVPEVRDRVVAGQTTVDEAYADAAASGRLDPATGSQLRAAMAEFAGTLLRWRHTHYRLAVRMLGERPGTGYTEGTPYLKSVRTIPVFAQVATNGPTTDELAEEEL